ncbi:hypothetical protein BGP_2426 [Beggiatoa sp. PS]|nr:hypothetical protein BGP_2426 [Beggiatoa sp. PS]
MNEESIRLLVQNVLQDNPEILNEFLKKHQKDNVPTEKLDKPFTIRLSKEMRERIDTLSAGSKKQSKVIREALDIGLTQMDNH